MNLFWTGFNHPYQICNNMEAFLTFSVNVTSSQLHGKKDQLVVVGERDCVLFGVGYDILEGPESINSDFSVVPSQSFFEGWEQLDIY